MGPAAEISFTASLMNASTVRALHILGSAVRCWHLFFSDLILLKGQESRGAIRIIVFLLECSSSVLIFLLFFLQCVKAFTRHTRKIGLCNCVYPE